MTQTDEPSPPGRYMTLGEVARELGLKSPGSVRNKIYAGQLVGVNVTTVGKSQLRVTRRSFEAYCERIEREALERFSAVNA
jgi:hypothetical protein